MIAPLLKTGWIDSGWMPVVAILLGVGMGVFLERAGFGSAKKLVSQFYLNDMTVFKVMFMAIITAMTGIYLSSVVGFLDMEKVSVVGTYLVPQIVGGLLLGVGFVVGGYCPGTGVVAAATGKIDGMLFILGVFLGTFVYGEVSPWVNDFANSSSLGQITLYEISGIPYGVLVVAIICVALAGFWGATWVEKRFASKSN